jgi:low temperature requirement protein LtrA
MAESRNNLRSWWQPPRKTIDREEDRRVTFLELFYDLVYVVLIAELAHSLATNVTLTGVVGFAFLFVIVWWAWINGTLYHELHGNNDIRTRIFTFLQMFTVAGMAVFAHNALGEGSIGFAWSYIAFQLILTYLWWRTGVHDPLHRPLSIPYVLAYLFNTLLFIASVFVSIPWRFILWGIALVISLLLPMLTLRTNRNAPEIQEEIIRSSKATPSMVERFGLFTIIVLGEVVAGTIRGVAGYHPLNLTVGITAAIGMVIAIGIWWIYFDFISGRPPLPGLLNTRHWLYLHLPMTLGITAVGAAVFNFVEHAGEPLPASVRWLLSGSMALVLVCIALLMRSTLVHKDLFPYYRRGGIITIISAILIFLLGFTNLTIIPILTVTAVLLLVPVLYGVIIWIKAFGGQEISITNVEG